WGRVVLLESRLFFNGTIITCDDRQPRAEAVLTVNDRIKFAGSLEKAKTVMPSGTLLTDLDGKTLIPGFNDNHVHTFIAATYNSELNLYGKSCDEICDIVRQKTAGLEKGEMIFGNSWDTTYCPHPHKSFLDKAAPDNPVALYQVSGHGVWVNTPMLRKLGITKKFRYGQGGQILLDEMGEPSGILRGSIVKNLFVFRYLRKMMNPAVHEAYITGMMERFNRKGICSVQDNTWVPFTVRLLERLKKENRLTCRFSCWPSGDFLFRLLFWLFPARTGNDEWLHMGPVKYIADGGFATRTAWLFEPYADEPGNYGSPRITPRQIGKIIRRAARRRRQVVIHAIGDRTVHEILNAMENAQDDYPWIRDLRFRIDHLQLVKPSDIERIKQLGVVAGFQPLALFEPARDLRMLGDERAEMAYPYRTFLDTGIPVSFGSDIPGEIDYDPLLGLYYAVTRKSRDGLTGPLNSRECLTPEEALHCYTMGSAYAEGREKVKGSITEGKLADFAVLSDDLTKVAPEHIKDIKVLKTVVGGKIVYEWDASRNGG
ncbi:MAG: amidohydrolase, partial [Spirochaetales bacterium]|nr:amidohydrolase [Spirochaetales bacterium]